MAHIHAPVPADTIEKMHRLPQWALLAAASVVSDHDPITGRMNYCLPAGVKCRLTVEVAQLLIDMKADPSLAPNRD